MYRGQTTREHSHEEKENWKQPLAKSQLGAKRKPFTIGVIRYLSTELQLWRHSQCSHEQATGCMTNRYKKTGFLTSPRQLRSASHPGQSSPGPNWFGPSSHSDFTLDFSQIQKETPLVSCLLHCHLTCRPWTLCSVDAELDCIPYHPVSNLALPPPWMLVLLQSYSTTPNRATWCLSTATLCCSQNLSTSARVDVALNRIPYHPGSNLAAPSSWTLIALLQSLVAVFLFYSLFICSRHCRTLTQLIVKQRRKTTSRNEAFYVAPCGLRLRNIEEVFQYIVDTESSLEIDCFSFELSIDVSHEWEPFKRIYFSEDITKGEENVKISCVNSLDESFPLPLTYCNVRLPTEHVPLNLDQDFLVCCDCLDNCQEKEKCACRQLTIQGTRILDRHESPNAGYQHRRLYDQVQGGIYECNSRCKCAPNRCSNRVVQHPLRLKLQLFKTARRGWGVRTLCDIPRGGFICVYVGKMLSEAIANEEGKQMIGGDDYYAELDYIEVMENAKEGYEDEAVNPDEASLMGSDTNESDGFYSENEADNPTEDRDFSQPSYHKKDSIGKRQKSARLQERARGIRPSRAIKALKDGSPSGSAVPSEDESNAKKESKSNENDKNDSESKGASVAGSPRPSDEDDEDDEKQRRPQTFLPTQMMGPLPRPRERKSVREYYAKDDSVYIMDAKYTGNIGRYLNHACEPNVFVQNVFVDTHDLRFPWVAFFAIHNIRAGTELTWDYNYEVDSVPGKIKYCYCSARKCRGRLL